MDLSIIIVTWNSQKQIKNNLQSLLKSKTDFSYEIFVVDNNSSDQTVEIIKNEFPTVNLIVNDANLGFAKANNQAIKKVQGDFVLLLNPDMKVNEDTLDKMIQWMQTHQNAFVASCKLVDENGQIIKHVRRFPTFFDQMAIIKKIPHIFPGILNKYLQKNFDYNQESVVDSIRGSFFMIRKTAIAKLGLLDERYFLWLEEVDYCKRVYQAGGQVWYAPICQCQDYIGQSFKQVVGLQKQKYFRNSMLTYFQKWHPKWQYFLLKAAWPFGIFLAWLAEKLKWKTKNVT